ncbi:hypothetical protein LN650_26335 [Klebsiella pneumoniae subsp. pneumoniae]|nr:hypothetical protein [Klebsiella pneumoniae subsp. pneumoniae]
MDCFLCGGGDARTTQRCAIFLLAIGGSRVQRGVISSTRTILARKFGVRSAMPTATALAVPASHAASRPLPMPSKEASNHIREIFSRYTSRIEPLSLDEASS